MKLERKNWSGFLSIVTMQNYQKEGPKRKPNCVHTYLKPFLRRRTRTDHKPLLNAGMQVLHLCTLNNFRKEKYEWTIEKGSSLFSDSTLKKLTNNEILVFKNWCWKGCRKSLWNRKEELLRSLTQITILSGLSFIQLKTGKSGTFYGSLIWNHFYTTI